MTRIKWREIDPQVIAKYCIDYEERWGDYPSLREIFYAFIDKLWSNTKSSYGGLKRYLKKHRLNGNIDWKLIRDGGGRRKFDFHGTFRTPKEQIEHVVEEFKDSVKKYKPSLWKEQPKRVVLVIEKEADFPAVAGSCKALNVNVCTLRGYAGLRTWFELAEDFNELEDVEEVVVLAITDCDPSGKNIVEVVKKSLKRLDIDVKVTVPPKILLTKEQVDKYNIPCVPEDAEEIAKLMNDPRYQKWEHGLFRAETAAFRVLYPDKFANIIQSRIVDCLDKSTAVRIMDENARMINKVKLETLKLGGFLDDGFEGLDFEEN